METNKDCVLPCSSNKKYKHEQDVSVWALEEVGLEIVVDGETSSDTMECSSDGYGVLDLSIINGSDDINVPFICDDQDDSYISIICDNDHVPNQAIIQDIGGSHNYDSEADIDGSVIHGNRDDIDVSIIYCNRDDDGSVIYCNRDDIDGSVIFGKRDDIDVSIIYNSDNSYDYDRYIDISDSTLEQHDLSDSDDDDDIPLGMLARRIQLDMFNNDSGCSDVNDQEALAVDDEINWDRLLNTESDQDSGFHQDD